MANKKLSKSEQEFIQTHALMPEWTDKRIADAIKRSEDVVVKYRKKFGIHKTGTGSVATEKTLLNKNNINKSSLTEDEKIIAWKKYFKSTDRYRRLAKVLMPEDMEYFVNTWSNYAYQLDDMKPSEEEQLEMLITYKIRINHNRLNYKKAQEYEIELTGKLAGRGDKDLDLENEKDRFIYEMVTSNNRHMQELNKELKELNDQHDKCLKSLNVTREQREQKEKIGGDTFFGLVRSMNELDKRREMGRYNELMKMATKKKIAELKKPHKFSDGMEEAIILDGEDFMKEKGTEDAE